MDKTNKGIQQLNFSCKVHKTLHPDIQNLDEEQIVEFISNKIAEEVIKEFGKFDSENLTEITEIALNIWNKYFTQRIEVTFVGES